MGKILGLGVTHFPPLMLQDDQMAMFLERILKSEKVPELMKNPASWPALMREEWGNDRGVTAASGHRKRLVTAMMTLRRELDAFNPDCVLIWGDDQYENFREDIVPPFCVFALGTVDSSPFVGKPVNVWNEPADKAFRLHGHRAAAKFLVERLMSDGFDMPYAYSTRYKHGLNKAFINTVLYLDYERKGWTYPVIPFHVNCYGTAVIRNQGLISHLDPGEVPEDDPPGPTPRRCFDLGVSVARALRASPWRVALIASSSWSHAFLTEKNSWVMPDSDTDQLRYHELRDGKSDAWRNLTTKQVEDAGEHEFLNWVCLAGAMHELGKQAEIVDYVESYVFNSNKCFALFR